MNSTEVEVRRLEDIVVTIQDFETKNYCKDSKKVGCKRSVKPIQQSAQPEDEEVIGIFRKRNYKVRISFGVNESVMNPFRQYWRNEPAQNLIDSRFIPPSWTNCIEPVREPKLRGVKSDKSIVFGVTILHDCI